MCKVRKSDETQSAEGLDRRGFLKAGVAGAAAVTTLAAGSRPASAAENPYAEPAKPGLPPSNMVLNLKRTALVVTDPQVDFLSPEGVTWGVVGESVKQHNTVENLRRLFEAAKQVDMTVAISPHYYYPTDKGWKFEGALEKLMHKIGIDGKTIVTSPHKVYGPEANDLVLQLRKNHVDQVILAGMSANLCVESHLRELLEQGFEVAVVKDATAAAMVPEGDGYLAAIINFRYIANAVWTTDEAVKRISMG
jgi:nicotinamidase-related amidase